MRLGEEKRSENSTHTKYYSQPLLTTAHRCQVKNGKNDEITMIKEKNQQNFEWVEVIHCTKS